MGLAIKELIQSQEIRSKDLAHKPLAIDAYNLLYQFLTTIRSSDGSVLTDSKGNVTSHLVGLFARTTHFLDEELQLAFVFDGKPPELKKMEQERRRSLKIRAATEFKRAEAAQDIQGMKKYAGRTAVLTKQMIEESKRLLEALGIPCVQAPSEGEAQAAILAREGIVYASVSQDFDSLLYGTPRLIRNLSVAGRRKRPNSPVYESVQPEMIHLKETLGDLGISQDQLIILAILVGTDYNPGGVKGIGPKNALKLVKEYENKYESLFQSVNWQHEVSWKEVYEAIVTMPAKKEIHLQWHPINADAVRKILVDEHEFSSERVDTVLDKLREQKKQSGLRQFF
ncbi:flap endonuclease-1 [Candidatus Woesearchaeota archaeon]|nr:flap endonuclease-1 [Candidatus Woesearchaeota archaeon]